MYGGKRTQTVVQQFTGIVKRALNQFLNEQINHRLQSAINKPEEAEPLAENEEMDEEIEEEAVSRIVTTEEELEGYHIVKSIVRDVVAADRIGHKDTVNYMAIILDDSNRKTICRLYLNSDRRKYLELLNDEKGYESVIIENVNDIYDYADRLKEAAARYDLRDAFRDAGTHDHDNEEQILKDK